MSVSSARAIEALLLCVVVVDLEATPRCSWKRPLRAAQCAWGVVVRLAEGHITKVHDISGVELLHGGLQWAQHDTSGSSSWTLVD